MIVARAIGQALRNLLATDPRVVVLGEDITDPYGGAFKVTRGLSTEFPDRVRGTPVSEGAIAGIAAGLALAGMRPIAEVMFGDFIGLCFDQIVNHAAKYRSMYAERVSCPVVIRCPSGGGRGYGPTHSQSLEKHFLGTPHLRVAAASAFHPPEPVFRALIDDDRPSIHVEHKLLYPRETTYPSLGRVGDLLASEDRSPGFLPTVRLSAVPPEDCVLTLLAYGHLATVAALLVERLAVEEEVFVELLVPAQLAPMDWDVVERSAAVTRRLVTVEEGTAGWSWGTEAAAVIGARLFGRLRAPVRVVASAPTVIPSARNLEAQVLAGSPQIEDAVREVLR